MNFVNPWLRVRCPDCRAPLAPAGAECHCPGCGRVYRQRNGFHEFLPAQVAHGQVKDSEKQGWDAVGPRAMDEELRQFYLALPYAEDDSPVATHYRESSRQFRAVLEYLGDVTGKRGLDLGGGIGWAAYRFAQRGAQMVLCDYNDSATTGLAAAAVYQEQGAPFDRIRADAEQLPFEDGQFDFVFCSSFLHHLVEPWRAIADVQRILKPGGSFFAIKEAFCPFWMGRGRGALKCEEAARYIDAGINEQVYYQSQYRRYFRKAGLEFETVNPRWDALSPGAIGYGIRLGEPGYVPEILANRRARGGAAGAAARMLLKTQVWRVLAQPAVFRLLRPLLLNGTSKFRILIGTKRLARS